MRIAGLAIGLNNIYVLASRVQTLPIYSYDDLVKDPTNVVK
jgi:hypothetical protein